MEQNKKRYLLAADNGGTYIKAALFDAEGNQLGIARHYNQMLTERPGYAEYDQEALWQTNCRCMREVIQQTGIDPEAIACVGYAGQGKGLYMVDAQGNNLRNAITSSDARAYAYSRRWLEDGTGQRLYPKLYQQAHPGQPVSILAWLKDHEPEVYQRIRWVFSMKDFLFYRLTGTPLAGKGCQSGSCMVDLNTGEYDDALLSAYGIPEVAGKLPPMAWDTALCGVVSEEAAALCGCAPGTPVSAGMFDVDAAAIAMGVVDPSPIFLICGTHGINGYIAPAPVTNGTVMLNSLYSLPDTYLIEEGSPSSAGALEWVIHTLFEQEREDMPRLYARINRMVAELPPEESNLVFLPFLNGSGFNPIARGGWMGLSQAHSKAHMLRAVYEGVVFSHMSQVERLLQNRERPEKILMAGGASNSEAWMQIFADALQIPIEIVAKEEMGAKGVAIASAAAVGIYPGIREAVQAMKRGGHLVHPRPAYRDIYANKYETFRMVSGNMDAVWPRLLDEK